MPDHEVAQGGVSVLHTLVFMAWLEIRCHTHTGWAWFYAYSITTGKRSLALRLLAFVMHGVQMDDILCWCATPGATTE